MRQHFVRWDDGLERAPSGRQVREIPVRHVWSSGLWVSKDGELWRRQYQWATRTWQWSSGPSVPAMNPEGRLGVNLASFVTLELAIALAWLRRGMTCPPRVHLRTEHAAVHAQNLAWAEPDDETDEQGEIQGEVWSPVRGRIGCVPLNGSGYHISSRARLRNPRGVVTCGFWVEAVQARMAAVKDVGLCDLYTCARLRPPTVVLQPHFLAAANCLATSNTPRDLARVLGVQLSTAWTYITRAAQHVPGTELRRLVSKLVDHELWAALSVLKAAGRPEIGMRLLDLMPVVEKMVGRGVFMRDTHKMAQLRLGRLAMAAP